MGGSSSKVDYAFKIQEADHEKNESAVYRSSNAKENFIVEIPGYPGIKTVQQLYLKALKDFAKREFLGTRRLLSNGKRGEYEWKTYSDAKKLADQVGRAMYGLNMAPVNSDNLRF